MPLMIQETANSYQELMVKVAKSLGLTLAVEGVTVWEPGTFKIVQDSLNAAQQWSLGPNGETMKNGERFDTELAEKFKTIGKSTYMLGKAGTPSAGRWYRAAEKSWVYVGADEPTVENAPAAVAT